MSIRASVAVSAVLLAATAVVGPSPALASRCGSSAAAPLRYDHVIVVFMENRDLDHVYGNPASPFWNRLAASCGSSMSYYGVAHPSIPNYLAVTSGATYGVTSSVWPSTFRVSAPSVFGELDGSWREEAGGMPAGCSLGATGGVAGYVSLVNPATYYADVAGLCATHDVPLGSAIDFSQRLTFVTGDMCSNEHNCDASTGDAWLHAMLRPVFRSSTYAQGRTAVVVTYDENEYSASPVPFIIAAPTVPEGAQPAQRFDHYSLLATIQDMLGVRCLQLSCSAPSMRSAFHA